VDGGAGRIAVIDPATGARIAEQALADASDVDRAVGRRPRCHHSGA
jgi:aldehyde dehydrogenase (NAD+)